MKKLALLLPLVALMAFTSCNDIEFPHATSDRYQLETLKATAGDGCVTLNWADQKDVANPLQYLVIWTAAKSDVQGGEMLVTPDKKEITIDNLVNDCSYTFSVQTKYPSGLSQKLTASCTPKSTRIPATNFKVMAGDKRVFVSWTAPETGLMFTYKLDVLAGDQLVKSMDISALETSALVEQLTNGIEYTFNLTCVYAHGNSPAVSAKATPGEISPINASIENPRKFEMVTFEYNPAYFVSGEIASVEWTFDDGSSVTTPAAMHCFGTTGKHTVTIKVTYTNGRNESASTQITVGDFSWSKITGVGYQKSSNIVFAPDGQTFYTASQTGKTLIAVDAINGTIKWEYTTAAATYGAGPAVGPDGTIYFGTEDGAGTFYAINPSGSLKWQKELGKAVKSSPAVTSDGMVYALADGGFAFAFDSDGNQKWSKTLSGNSAGVAVNRDGTVYFATSDGVWAFSASGAEKWKPSEKLAVTERGGSIAIGNGIIYVTLKGKAGCAAIDASTGSVKWKYATTMGDCYHPVVDAEGTVYFCEKAGYLYAVKSSGALKWEEKTGLNFIYSGFALDANGRAIISEYATPFGLVAISGSGSRSVLTTIGVQTMSPVTLGPDNRIYYSTNGSIEAYDICVAAATGGWPMRGANCQGNNSLK